MQIPISSLDAPQLDVYARLNENQLRTYYEPQPGLFVAESPNVILRALQAGYEPVSFLVEERELSSVQQVLELAPDVPVYYAPRPVLLQLTGFALTRGLLCVMRRKALPEPGELLKTARRVAVLEEVENPTNVGAIMRSAAALGMDAVLLSPGCSDPLYRRAARVSMGTVFQIPWTIVRSKKETWPESGLALLKRYGFTTAALALSDQSIRMDDPSLPKTEKLALILGTEGDGLKEQTIAGCDYTVKIPMTHGVDSLNVAAASAVAFWAVRI